MKVESSDNVWKISVMSEVRICKVSSNCLINSIDWLQIAIIIVIIIIIIIMIIIITIIVLIFTFIYSFSCDTQGRGMFLRTDSNIFSGMRNVLENRWTYLVFLQRGICDENLFVVIQRVETAFSIAIITSISIFINRYNEMRYNTTEKNL